MLDETVTTKQIATAIARDPLDPENMELAMNRVQFWDQGGLFDICEVRSGGKRVGRGRSNQYLTKAVYWASLFYELADQNVGLEGIMMGLLFVKFGQDEALRSGEPDPIERAIAGDPPDVIAVVPSYWNSPFKQSGPPFRVMLQMNPGEGPSLLLNSPVSLDEWSSGHFVNLTKVFSRVRI